MYTYIYKFARDLLWVKSFIFSTVFPSPRGRAPEAAQGSIFFPKWVPKLLQNRFRSPPRSLKSIKIRKGLFKEFACSSLLAFIVH